MGHNFGRGAQILMLQGVRRQGLGKSGLKFHHGGGGYQNSPKILTSFTDGPLPKIVLTFHCLNKLF